MGFLPGRKPPGGGGRDDPDPGPGGQAFFAGLGADNAAFRDTMARFHADLAEYSQAQVGIAGQQINEFGYQSLSYSRAAAEAAADAAQARRKAQEARVRAESAEPQRHRVKAEQYLREAGQHDERARVHSALANDSERRRTHTRYLGQASVDEAQYQRGLATKLADYAQDSRDRAQRELNRAAQADADAASARVEAHKLDAQADELGVRSRQLAEQAKQARSQARALLHQQARAVDQRGQSQQRAQDYQRRGAGQVVYDHAGIEAAIVDLQRVLDRAQANLDGCRQVRLWLQHAATGASAAASRDRLLRLEQINQHVIDAARSALAELGVANHDMARIEQQNAAGYS